MDINIEFEFDDSGLKKLRKNLERIKESIPFEEIFTPEFMKRYTKSPNFKEFILESGFVNPEKPFTQEVFGAIPDEDWDKYVSKHTSFSSWQDMLEKAGGEYISNVLSDG